MAERALALDKGALGPGPMAHGAGPMGPGPPWAWSQAWAGAKEFNFLGFPMGSWEAHIWHHLEICCPGCLSTFALEPYDAQSNAPPPGPWALAHRPRPHPRARPISPGPPALSPDPGPRPGRAWMGPGRRAKTRPGRGQAWSLGSETPPAPGGASKTFWDGKPSMLIEKG